MADSNSSVVSIVGIIAIVILVGAGLYLVWFRGGAEPEPLDIDVNVEEFPMHDRIEPPSEWVVVMPPVRATA
jgi:hypothetical protein